jgi:chemotaxis response regulator CheB
MPYRKSYREKPRRRVLIIHHAGRMRNDLADSWMKAGWDVFEAEGRTDGLPLMFQLHPDLISLEVVAGQENSWDTLYSIRLLTLTPVVILTDGPPPSSDIIIENSEVIATSSPISVSKIISISKTLWKSVSQSAHPVPEESQEDSIVPAN